jgi:hypothetical protein
MLETIKSIKEVENVNIAEDCRTYDGIEIETSQQKIYLLIDDSQSCCEQWGYFMSEDNVDSFVGATLIDIKLTDTELKTGTIEELGNLDEGGLIFVDLITNIGTLQFVAYNIHNGYYGHTAKVISTQLNHEECL